MIFMAFFAAVGQSMAFGPSVIPEPVSVKYGTGVWTLDSQTVHVFGPLFGGALDVANYGVRLMRFSTMFLLPVSSKTRERRANAQAIRFVKSGTQMGHEDYKLHVSDVDASIVASSSSGLFYSLVTLL